MATEDLGKRFFENSNVKRAREPDGLRDIVKRQLWLKLLKEPEALLRK